MRSAPLLVEPDDATQPLFGSLFAEGLGSVSFVDWLLGVAVDVITHWGLVSKLLQQALPDLRRMCRVVEVEISGGLFGGCSF